MSSEIDMAYKVAERSARERLAAGEHCVGYKITVTGAGDRFYGRLFGSMVRVDGQFSLEDFQQAVVETEVAFRLGAGVDGASATLEAVLAATDSIGAALEIPNVTAKAPGQRPTLSEMVAANAFAAYVVVPEEWTQGPFSGEEAFSVATWKDGSPSSEVAATSKVSELAGHVAWLASALEPLGDRLDAGMIVMTGSAGKPFYVAGPSEFRASFAGLGEVSARFT